MSTTVKIHRSFVAAQAKAISYLARHSKDGFTPTYWFVDGGGEIKNVHFRTVDDYEISAVEVLAA